MRPRFSVLVLLAVPLAAQDPPREPDKAVAFESPAIDGRIFRGERDAPAVRVHIREGGAIELEDGDQRRDVTLDELGAFLAKSRDKDDLEQRKVGKSGFEEALVGIPMTRLFLSLDADPEVPWLHLQWAMAIATEQRYRKLEMTEGTRRLLAYLPIQANVDYIHPPLQVTARVRLLARAERPLMWGDLEVLRPAKVRFSLEGEETGDLGDVTAYLRRLRKVAEGVKDEHVIFHGDLEADGTVPYSKVFDVMETLVGAGVSTADWHAANPPEAIRAVRRLPYPAEDCDEDTQDEEGQEEETVVADGVVATGMWMPRDLRITALSRGESDGPAVQVRLKKSGVVQVKDREAWTDVTLDECSEFLARWRDSHAVAMQAKGEAPFDELPGGAKATKVRLSIEAEPAVPWRHVQWVRTLAAEQHFRMLAFSDGRRTVLALTGVDHSVGCGRSPDRKPPPELLIRVRLVVREDPSGALRVAYSCGDKDIARADLAARLRRCKAGIERARKGETYKDMPESVRIRAGAKVPFADVLGAMDACIDAGFAEVDIDFGEVIPSRTVRSASRLPEPADR